MDIDLKIANNGKEAVKLCKEEVFDIVLMDLHMPILNGFEACKEIRDFDTKTPIIALSAATMPEDIDYCKKIGMQEHLAKPVNFNELNNILYKFTSNTLKKNKRLSRELSLKPYKKFITSYEDIEIKLEKTFDTKEFYSIIRKLKKSSDSLYFDDISNIIDAIEREENPTIISHLAKELIEEIKKCIEEIKNELGK